MKKLKQDLKRLENLSIKEIRNFFGFGNKRAHLLKSINVPPVTKLEWLEEIRQSLCRLPTKIGKKVAEEMENIR